MSCDEYIFLNRYYSTIIIQLIRSKSIKLDHLRKNTFELLKTPPTELSLQSNN